MINLTTWIIAGLLIVLTVSFHFEMMREVSDRLVPWAQHRFHGRRVVAITVLALMLGHIFEIWLFAVTYMLVCQLPVFGSITGDFDGSLNSFLYFSTVHYTSLGASGVQPQGAIRNISAAETLTGIMMTTWSASFTYLKMEQIWQHHKR